MLRYFGKLVGVLGHDLLLSENSPERAYSCAAFTTDLTFFRNLLIASITAIVSLADENDLNPRAALSFRFTVR